MDPKAYWVGFNQVKGIGAVRTRGLLDYFGTLEIAWQAPAEGLLAAGLPQKVVENLLQARSQNNLEKAWETVQKSGVHVITWDEAAYPARLKQIDQPPPVLYIRGEITSADDLAVGIVGTRRVTSYGRQVTEEVASFLARNGITVVSGLARGVDGIAHDTALKAGGRTIAVLGCGVDRVYPPEHLRLAHQIVEQGALVSDYAMGTPPDGVNFPPRNRIISGLSMGVVVIEASEESGALITATFAAEQGREVFAVPGNITAPQSKGTNRLIRDGATPMLKPEDILGVLNLDQVSEKQAARKALPSDEVEASLMRVLAIEPLHVDEICVQTGLPIDKVSATLTIMELKGMVRNLGGMSYSMVREASTSYGSQGE
jgi:DNA processing protein